MMAIGVDGYEGIPGPWIDLGVDYSTTVPPTALQRWDYNRPVETLDVGGFTVHDWTVELKWLNGDTPNTFYSLRRVYRITVHVPVAGTWSFTRGLLFPGVTQYMYSQLSPGQREMFGSNMYAPLPEEGVSSVTTSGPATITLALADWPDGRYSGAGYKTPLTRGLSSSDFYPPLVRATTDNYLYQHFRVQNIDIGPPPFTGQPFTTYVLVGGHVLGIFPDVAGDGRGQPTVQHGSDYYAGNGPTRVSSSNFPAAYPILIQTAFDVGGMSGTPTTPPTATATVGEIEGTADVVVGPWTPGGVSPTYADIGLFGSQIAFGFDATYAREDFRRHVDPLLEWPDGAVDVEFETATAAHLTANLSLRYYMFEPTGDMDVTFHWRSSEVSLAALATPQVYARSGTVLWQANSSTLVPYQEVIVARDMTPVADPVTGEFTIKTSAVLNSMTIPVWTEPYLYGMDQSSMVRTRAVSTTYLCRAPQVRYLYEVPQGPISGEWVREDRRFVM
jgi:hypothetical protein